MNKKNERIWIIYVQKSRVNFLLMHFNILEYQNAEIEQEISDFSLTCVKHSLQSQNEISIIEIYQIV